MPEQRKPDEDLSATGELAEGKGEGSDAPIVQAKAARGPGKLREGERARQSRGTGTRCQKAGPGVASKQRTAGKKHPGVTHTPPRTHTAPTPGQRDPTEAALTGRHHPTAHKARDSAGNRRRGRGLPAALGALPRPGFPPPRPQGREEKERRDGKRRPYQQEGVRPASLLSLWEAKTF